MKHGIKRIFGIFFTSAIGLSCIPFDAFVAEVPVSTQITAPAEPVQDIAPAEPIEDIWLAITELEQETGAVTKSD